MMVAVAALCVPLAGCAAAAGGSAAAGSFGSVAAAAAPGGGETDGYMEADVQFSERMIPHHRQTIALADLAAGRTSNPYILELSKKLITDEQTDITLMESWLRSWGMPEPPEDAVTHDTPGMLGPTQLAELERRTGAEFDRMWLTALAKQLDSGIQMAEKVRVEGVHGPTAELSKQIIANQRALIDEIVQQV